MAERSALSNSRVGIVTVWDGQPSYECALPLWCQGALLLADSIRPVHASVNLLVFSPLAGSSECRAAHFTWPNETASTAEAYADRHRDIMLGRRAIANLLKWAVFSLDQHFELVIFSDLDVDLLPSAIGRANFPLDAWRASVDAFLRSGALFVGTPDAGSPVNGGSFLAKPHAATFATGLRVLRSANWTAARGFEDMGPPSALVHSPTLLKRLHAGRGGPLAWVYQRLNRSLGIPARNDWDFVHGSLDQGLLLHVLYLRLSRGTWAALPTNEPSPKPTSPIGALQVNHFFTIKPWRGHAEWRTVEGELLAPSLGPQLDAQLERLRSKGARPDAMMRVWHSKARVAVSYLQHLEGWQNLNATPQTQTRCRRHLAAMRRDLIASGVWASHQRANLHWAPFEPTIAPNPAVATFDWGREDRKN